MTAIRNEGAEGGAISDVSRLALAVAGSTDYADLMRRLGAYLQIDAADGGSARLWRLRGDVPEQCVTYPAHADLDSPDPTCLATAAADGWATVDDAGIVGLRGDEGPVGALEVRPADLVAPDLREPLARLVGARLNGLARAYEYRERTPQVSLADDAQEIEDVMTAFAAQAKLMLDHDRLSVYLLSPDGTAFERFAVATSPILPGESEVIPVEQVGLTRVVRANESLVSGDFGRDDRILGLEDSVIARAGFHGLVSVPLRLGGKPFGLLNFVSKTPNFYSDADIAVAQQTADDIAVFLQYLRMQRAMRAAVQREAVAEERNRVAREFHDTLAQTLSQIASKAAVLTAEADGKPLQADLTAMRDLAQYALDQGRRSLQDLLPSQLEERTLSEAIRAELGRLETDEGIVGSLIATGAVDELPTRIEVAVFRIFTEAITNVVRHADATAVSVELQVEDDVRMSIRDNGRGITHGATTPTHTGFGIETMRDRARALGGRLLVSAAVGPGTEVFLQLPEIGASPSGRRGSVEAAAAPAPTVTRVLLVDDHPAFREGISQVLSREQGLRIVGEAGTAAEALAVVRSRRPDVVLLDLDLPDSTGVDIIDRVREIKEIAPDATVVVMSAFADDADITAALAAGVAGYVAKSSSPSTVIDVIRSAVNGATVVTSPGRPRGAAGRDTSFTSRELEVLRGIASGKTNAEIGRELYLADKTVERIVATIANKLGAKNRAHAVALGVVSRLVDVRNL